MTARIVGVIDIGKSNAKFAVVDLATRAELDVRKHPNVVQAVAPYPHYDIAGLWEFLCEAIADLNRTHPLDAIVTTTHGASAALVGDDGDLSLPVLDYEYAGPDSLRREYDQIRPDFSETFTPRLPAGLNLGAQLYWQARTFPGAWAKTRWVLPYPQYWSYRLTGVPSSEITSLGCHTDLWSFETDLYSSLVVRQGWLDKMPEVRPAWDVLGIVQPALCKRLGLRPRVPVHVGIHDSNASLLSHLLEHEPPFAVVSTGTWVVVFAPGGNLAGLDPARDCLANIDAFGHPVPSARFMGGREFEQLIDHEAPVRIGEAAIARVLDEGIMLLPSVTQGSGPFPDRKAHWNRPAALIDSEARYVAVSFYLALMTTECLRLTGADGRTVVEGPFAANRLFLEMLVAATGRPVEAMTGSQTGTSIGAALLARMEPGGLRGVLREPSEASRPMAEYAEKWRAAVSA
ncbi:MAG TPA: carbohydrate kinase [Alphaproteobacteria bacterium]|nr:carbohydrate kinase [Alphaproteobacteria bacterium]